MSELTGLDLRRAALEALGWKTEWYSGDAWWLVNPDGNKLCGDEEEPDSLWSSAPAIESDPAVSEPMFLEWCEKNGYSWLIYNASGRVDVIIRDRENDADSLTGHAWSASGSTPSEARARAIVAASQASQEKQP